MTFIPFNYCTITPDIYQSVQHTLHNYNANDIIENCCQLLKIYTQAEQVLLTPSCTDALEMAALLIEIEAGDEIIMPSFTFPSTANAFILRGAVPVFVDIRADTCNINEQLIENAITNKTKAIVVVHYAGVSCEMDEIMALATQYNLVVIEDAAHAIGAFYKNRPLGSIGHLATFSFHSTKNIQCGEGGALLINEQRFLKRAAVLYEKGTNRQEFMQGKSSFYGWQDLGSSYSMATINAALLWPQLLNLEHLTQQRLKIWQQYSEILANKTDITLPYVPIECKHNAHIFYVKSAIPEQLIEFFRQHHIQISSHYRPLHNSPAGLKYGLSYGELINTINTSSSLLRLPIWHGVDSSYICEVLKKI